MFFNKISGKIRNIKLNAEEEKALHTEIKRQLLEDVKQHELDYACSVLWTLRNDFGFSRERCRKFLTAMMQKNRELEEYYLMDSGDGTWICKRKLMDDGCDVVSWYAEVGKEPTIKKG